MYAVQEVTDLIMHIANNKKLMGAMVNSRTSNVLGWITFAVAAATAVGYVASLVL